MNIKLDDELLRKIEKETPTMAFNLMNEIDAETTYFIDKLLKLLTPDEDKGRDYVRIAALFRISLLFVEEGKAEILKRTVNTFYKIIKQLYKSYEKCKN